MQFDQPIGKNIVHQREGKDYKMPIIHLLRISAWALIFFSFSACAQVSPSPLPFSSPTPDFTLPTQPTEPIQSTSAPTEDPGIEVLKDEMLVHLWALRGIVDNAEMVSVATSAPEDDEGCGTLDFQKDIEAEGEVILTLSYAPSLIPTQVNL